MIARKEYIFLILIMLISSFMVALCIHEGHNWSGDYALYIEQTQAILNGSVQKLYMLSKYSNDRAFRVQGPYLYPMGFPVLLIGPYCLFGMNFVALKIFCSLFFIGSLPVFYALFRPYFSHPFYPLCILVAIALHYEFVSFADFVYSDFPFFFFSGIVFLQMRKTNTATNQFWLGFLLFFTYFIRDAGIVLLPTLLVYQLQNKVLKTETKKRFYYLIPYVVFIVFFILNVNLFPKGTTNHYNYLWLKLSPTLFWKNILYYMRLFSAYFFLEIGGLVLLFLFLAGIFYERKKHLAFVAYIAGVLVIYLIWPAWQGMRFVFPVLPFILFFIVKGSLYFTGLLHIRQRYLAVLLVAGLMIMSYKSIQLAIQLNHTDTNSAYNQDTIKMYDYISKNIPGEEIIGFEKPRPLRLFTGHNSVLSNLDHFEDASISYLLIRKEDLVAGRQIPYQKVYETSTLILVHR